MRRNRDSRIRWQQLSEHVRVLLAGKLIQLAKYV
jgi:hypothetical protein